MYPNRHAFPSCTPGIPTCLRLLLSNLPILLPTMQALDEGGRVLTRLNALALVPPSSSSRSALSFENLLESAAFEAPFMSRVLSRAACARGGGTLTSLSFRGCYLRSEGLACVAPGAAVMSPSRWQSCPTIFLAMRAACRSSHSQVQLILSSPLALLLRLPVPLPALASTTSLTALDLGRNQLSIDAAQHLITPLRSLSQLQQLSLDYNDFKAAGAKMLGKVWALGLHTSLRSLDISGLPLLLLSLLHLTPPHPQPFLRVQVCRLQM